MQPGFNQYCPKLGQFAYKLMPGGDITKLSDSVYNSAANLSDKAFNTPSLRCLSRSVCEGRQVFTRIHFNIPFSSYFTKTHR